MPLQLKGAQSQLSTVTGFHLHWRNMYIYTPAVHTSAMAGSSLAIELPQLAAAAAVAAEPAARLAPADMAVLCAYAVGLVAIAGTVTWRQRRARAAAPTAPAPGGRAHVHGPAADEAAAFFLAERAAPWWAVAAAFFASNIGTDAIVGLASAGATVGVAAGFFDWASPFGFLALAYGFLPVYRSVGVFTLPEYAARRYPGLRGALRGYLSGVALLLYAVNKTAVALFCGALLVEAVGGVPGAAAVGGLLLGTAAFSLAGGLAAVLYVEVLNAGLLLGGGAAAAGLALRAVGGWPGLVAALNNDGDRGGGAGSASGLTPAFGHLVQPPGSVYALPALLAGAPFSILWYHCCDQEMVQRGLAGRSGPDARLGAVLAGFLKLTVPWTWAVPGIVARLLFPADLGCPTEPVAATLAAGGGGVGQPSPSTAPPPPPPPAPPRGIPGAPCARANLAYPALMLHLLPPGLLGCVLAAALGGVLSVLASTFNSASTIVASDVYRPLHPAASPASLVWVGRAWILVMTAAAVAWLPALGALSPSLYVSMQLLNAALAPPIAVVFAAALAWPRANTTGALAALGLGHAAGLLRVVLGAALPPGSAAAGAAHPAAAALAASNFLLYSAGVGALATAALVAGSLATPAPRLADVAPLTHPAALAAWAAVARGCRRRSASGGRSKRPDDAAAIVAAQACAACTDAAGGGGVVGNDAGGGVGLPLPPTTAAPTASVTVTRHGGSGRSYAPPTSFTTRRLPATTAAHKPAPTPPSSAVAAAGSSAAVASTTGASHYHALPAGSPRAPQLQPRPLAALLRVLRPASAAGPQPRAAARPPPSSPPLAPVYLDSGPVPLVSTTAATAAPAERASSSAHYRHAGAIHAAPTGPAVNTAWRPAYSRLDDASPSAAAAAAPATGRWQGAISRALERTAAGVGGSASFHLAPRVQQRAVATSADEDPGQVQRSEAGDSADEQGEAEAETGMESAGRSGGVGAVSPSSPQATAASRAASRRSLAGFRLLQPSADDVDDGSSGGPLPSDAAAAADADANDARYRRLDWVAHALSAVLVAAAVGCMAYVW